MSTKKVVFVGPTKSGKSTFIRRHLNGAYINAHTPTIGVEVHPLRFRETSNVYNCWDTAGDSRYQGLINGYVLGADYGFVVVSGFDMDEVERWSNYLRSQNEGMEIHVIFNKMDLLDQDQIELGKELAQDTGYSFECVSCKDKVGMDKPFQLVF